MALFRAVGRVGNSIGMKFLGFISAYFTVPDHKELEAKPTKIENKSS